MTATSSTLWSAVVLVTRCRLRWHLCDVDPCVGELDAVAVQRSGAIYECGCEDIIEGDCDCDGNQLDALGGGGPCDADVDSDGICDDVDPCVGELDAVACATVSARFMSVAVRTSLRRLRL